MMDERSRRGRVWRLPIRAPARGVRRPPSGGAHTGPARVPLLRPTPQCHPPAGRPWACRRVALARDGGNDRGAATRAREGVGGQVCVVVQVGLADGW